MRISDWSSDVCSSDLQAPRLRRALRQEDRVSNRTDPGGLIMAWTRNDIAARAARELKDGFYVNLGIGIPTLVANNIPDGMTVTLQSENGMLGLGPFPFDGEEDAEPIGRGLGWGREWTTV